MDVSPFLSGEQGHHSEHVALVIILLLLEHNADHPEKPDTRQEFPDHENASQHAKRACLLPTISLRIAWDRRLIKGREKAGER
jgi:hypothetical protein